MSNLISPIMGHTMAFERRLEAVVIGPGKPGQVRVALGRVEHKFVADKSFDMQLIVDENQSVSANRGRFSPAFATLLRPLGQPVAKLAGAISS
jgi:hypothetical protein